MSYFKDKILPILIGSIIASLGALVLSIASDFAPPILPVLEALPVQLYLKLVLLLLLVISVISFLAIVLLWRSKDYKPRSLSGTYSDINWVAEISYKDKKREVSIELHWLCPKHKVFLGVKDAEVPDCRYYNLFCQKCDQVYELKSNGETIYESEAEMVIRQEILRRIRIKNV